MMRSVRLSADELDRLVRRLRAAGCVFAEEEAGLLAEAATSAEELETLTARRAAGEPLEPLLGWVEFCGLRLAVAPGVFVPRQRTALLVDEVVALVRPGSVVVDLGCGVGAIAAAVLARVPGVEVYAVDVDPAAVTCARRNLPAERVFEGDLYAALPTGLRGEVDVVAANAPYVPTDAIALMPREARDHEHRVALDGGADGLAVQRRVIAEAPAWLRPGGARAGGDRPEPARRHQRGAPRGGVRGRGGLRRRVRRAGRTRDDVPQRRYGRPVRPALEFSLHREVPRSGDGSHPHVRRSPGGGWLRSGAVAFLRGSVGYASASASSRSRGTGTASSDRASTRRRP